MTDDTPYPHTIYVKIKEHIMPMERGKYYEQPLSKVLAERNLGEVGGGGTQLGEDKRTVSFAGLDVDLANMDSALDLVRTTMIELGVPCGSELIYVRDGIRHHEPIGTYESLLIYLDMVGLPDAVYERFDFESTYVGLRQELQAAKAGEPHGALEGETELCIFVVGPSADCMYSVVKELPAKMPVFQNARVVFKVAEQQAAPSAVRLHYNETA